VGFETTVSADERPQTYALDRAVTGIGVCDLYVYIIRQYLFSYVISLT